MKIAKFPAAALLLLLWAVQPGLSQKVDFKEYKLRNGLRVILSEDHSAPTYSLVVAYNAGARDERPGQTGYAHLFEHMMFQGSQKVGKGEHMIIIESNGGMVNGNTTPDRTLYYQTLPANQLELGLFLEADRMRSLAITQQNLDNQRATVQEERRERYDNAPYGKTYETVLETAYENFAYKHPTIGSMADLDKASVADAAEFFRTYYAPNNAVLVLVGDFKSDDAFARIRKYFEDIPQQPAPSAPDMTEPVQTAERRKTIEDPIADLVALDIVYKIPPGDTPDWYSLSVAGVILSEGQSSRLYQKLVKEKQVVQSVYAYADERRGPGLFEINLIVRPGVDPAEVEKLLYEELEKLKTQPATDAELQKVRSLVRRSQADQLKSTSGRATLLAEAAIFFDDPGLVNEWPSKYNAVTKQRIQQAARQYFTTANRTVITTIPKAAPEPAANAGREE